MNKFYFNGFEDYEDGKMARLITTGEYEIPINVFIDNANDYEDMGHGFCTIDVSAMGSSIEIYKDEEDYRSAGTCMDIISMIPVGTFPLDDDDEDFEESPHILFSGKVIEAEANPDADEDEPDYCLCIETLGFEMNLFVKSDEEIENGNIVHGVAWLFGDIVEESEQ